METNKPIPIVVCGAGGRMGCEIIRLLANSRNAELRAAVEAPGHPTLGQDAGQAAQTTPLGVEISDDLTSALDGRSVILEFTSPEATLTHLRLAARSGNPMVIGTTGFSMEQEEELNELAGKIPTVVSPNMSFGIAVLTELVQRAAKALSDEFDVEIIEMHHRYKKDAPSGTALALARAASLGSDRKQFCFGRHGVAVRSSDEIAVFGVRGGDIVGDHIVLFAGFGERLELVHRAQSRESLARGAIKAAQWLLAKPPGRYSMRDVLGLGE